MNLPKICPKCGLSFKDGDAAYTGRGIQYCVGDIIEINDNGNIIIDLSDAGDDWLVDPYQITCSECSYQLFEKTIIINEEKFFVKKGEENEV